MMEGKKKYLGGLLLALLMAVTGGVLLRGQSFGLLWESLRRIKPLFVMGGLALMLGYVGCEAMCTHQILRRLGHQVPYMRCLGYSFVGFYVSSITPSATGGQPAQVYCMSRDRIPAAHGTLNMMLIAACYQVAALVWGGGVWLLCPRMEAFEGGMGILLLYGAGIMLLLTAGMTMLMFLPGLSRRIGEGILRLLTAMRILRSPDLARRKLERQLEEYAKGAACVRSNPGLTLQVFLLCLVQQGMLFSVPWTVYLAFGLRGCSWIQLAGLQALLTLAVCNLPLPGAVGPAEGGFVAAFTAVFGAGTVTPAMLVSRGISFYAFLLVSFIVSIFVHLRIRRQDREHMLREKTVSRKDERVRALPGQLRTVGSQKVC
ncbi:MAG: flippase-like domain-containing protein [bacterium]|nr:flippase-like domain-containing protein [bacterium]MCM1373541.1 flippase-like domain-containing protein [Muribaculum sp.]